MSMLNQIYYTTKRFVMDVKPFLILIVSYMIIIWILGSAFENAFESQDFDTVKVLYLNEDAGEQGEQFLKELTGMDQIKTLIELEEAESYEKAEKAIRKEKAEALLYLPKEFSKQVANQDTSSIVKVYRSKYSGFDATIVKSVVESYVSGLNAAGAVYRMQGNLDGFSFDMNEGIEKQPLLKEASPNAMGYYAIAMVLMMILIGADYGCEAIHDQYNETIGQRMRLSQMRPFAQYSGTVFGAALAQFIQAVIIIFYTRFAYDVNWGEHLLGLLGIVFTFCFVTSTLGGMFAVLTGDRQKASTMTSTCVFVFTFLAGGFVAMDFGAGKYISLSYYAQSAITNLIYDGDMSLVARNTGCMWGFALVFIVISVVVVGRKRV